MAKSKGAKYVYLTDLTQNAKDDATILADDRLHPSGKSYNQWVQRLVPELNLVIENLK
jgi:lysophospholipase L1-like esterase